MKTLSEILWDNEVQKSNTSEDTPEIIKYNCAQLMGFCCGGGSTGGAISVVASFGLSCK